MNTLFIDMDGVLVDLVGYLDERYWFKRPWVKGDYDLSHYFPQGVLNEVPWANLSRTREADRIMRACRKGYPRVVITSTIVPGDYRMLYGKTLWLYSNYPTVPFRPCQSANKTPLVRFGDLLDDSDSEVTAFREVGGRAILLTRQWNSGTDTIAETLRKIGG